MPFKSELLITFPCNYTGDIIHCNTYFSSRHSTRFRKNYSRTEQKWIWPLATLDPNQLVSIKIKSNSQQYKSFVVFTLLPFLTNYFEQIIPFKEKFIYLKATRERVFPQSTSLGTTTVFCSRTAHTEHDLPKS